MKRIVLASTSGTVAVSERADEMPDENCAGAASRSSRAGPTTPASSTRRRPRAAPAATRSSSSRVNPSLLLGPGRRSPVLDPRRAAVPRPRDPDDAAGRPQLRRRARRRGVAAARRWSAGAPGERYLLGGYNWTFAEFFGRLERADQGPGAACCEARGNAAAAGAAHAQAALYKATGDASPPVEPASVEMAQHFWYFDSTKVRASWASSRATRPTRSSTP